MLLKFVIEFYMYYGLGSVNETEIARKLLTICQHK